MSERVFDSFSNHGHGDSDAGLAAEAGEEQADDGHPNVEGETEDHDPKNCHYPTHNKWIFSAIIISNVKYNKIPEKSSNKKNHSENAELKLFAAIIGTKLCC